MADSDASMFGSVRSGLGDVGYAEDHNVAIKYPLRGWSV